MKRCRFGAGLLAVLLLSGILTSRWTEDHHREISSLIAQAEEASLRGDWDQSDSLIRQAKGQWEAHWGLSASLTDHSPMEQVDSLFEQLDVYLRARDPVGCGGLCAQLGKALEAIAESQSLTWWNLL